MATETHTIDQRARGSARSSDPTEPTPGLVLIFSVGVPRLEAIPLVDGALELGRGTKGDGQINDSCMSRRHTRVSFDGQVWRVEDLASRNGTWIDGERRTEATLESPGILRLGDSIFLFSQDIRRFPAGSMTTGDSVVMGPTLRRVWNLIQVAARDGDTLHITGESGSGKELAARSFHSQGLRAKGPFVAVNCATIPEGVAERLLFGARKGAYSGATESAQGYVQSADGGTLFLDEVGDLDLAVQAKLLRVLEAREVLALGDTTPRRVTLSICSATHRDLRARVAEDRFREDLYFRIGRPHVELPPLRHRREEIPFLIQQELARAPSKMVPEVGFVEACLLRTWPGNVRELLVEVRDAARRAANDGETTVPAADLAASAGTAIRPPSSSDASLGDAEPSDVRETRPAPAPLPTREEIEEALRREKGNVSTAARALGISRNQLRRWLEKHKLDVRRFGGGADE